MIFEELLILLALHSFFFCVIFATFLSYFWCKDTAFFLHGKIFLGNSSELMPQKETKTPQEPTMVLTSSLTANFLLQKYCINKGNNGKKVQANAICLTNISASVAVSPIIATGIKK